MRTTTQQIAALTAGLGVVAPVLLLTHPPAALRMVLALVVLLVLPGCAAICWLRVADLFPAAVVALATSIAVTILVSTALLYLGIWTWQLSVTVVSALAALAAAAQLTRGRAA